MIFIGLKFSFISHMRLYCNLFCMTVGTIMFSFSLFGKIIGLLMLGNAGFNIYILFRYPEFEDAQRLDAQSEISDYLSANPAFAKSVASLGMNAATGYLASNPGTSRKTLIITLLTSKLFFVI